MHLFYSEAQSLWKDMADEKLKVVLIKSRSRVCIFIYIEFLCHNSQ